MSRSMISAAFTAQIHLIAIVPVTIIEMDCVDSLPNLEVPIIDVVGIAILCTVGPLHV